MIEIITMTQLPPTRQLKKLSEIYDITSSKRVFESERKKSGVPFYRAREIVKLAQNGFVDNELFISEEMYKEYWEKYWLPKENDIMVTGVGTIGICYFVKENDRFYFKDGNILWFKNRWFDVNSRFVEYLFKTQTVRKQIDNNSWSVVATLTIQKAKEILIHLPPLPVQHKIVALLDEASAQITASKSVIQSQLDALDQLWQSSLSEVFEWKYIMKFVDELCTKVTDWTHATPKYIDKWVPFLSVKNVTWGTINFSDTRFISQEEHEQLTKRCKPELNDLLYTKVWTTWIAKVIDIDREFSIFVSLALLKPKHDIINVNFFEYMLNSPKAYEQAQARTRWVANRNLVINDIKQIQIPLPDLATQTRIVSQLDDLSRTIASLRSQYTIQLQHFDDLRASILDQAFTWKLESS